MSETCFTEAHIIPHQPIEIATAGLLIVQGIRRDQIPYLTAISRSQLRDPNGTITFTDAPDRINHISIWHRRNNKDLYQLVAPKTRQIVAIGWVSRAVFSVANNDGTKPNHRVGLQSYRDTKFAKPFLQAILKNGIENPKVFKPSLFRGFWAQVVDPSERDTALMKSVGFEEETSLERKDNEVPFVMARGRFMQLFT